MTDFAQEIFTALGLNEAGKVLEGPNEHFILADIYTPGDPATGEGEQMPVLLHNATGRRFTLPCFEAPPTTPPDPSLAPELTTAPGQFDPNQSADGAQHPQPWPPPQEEQAERPEPLQSFVHDPQPAEPEANVPPDFELKVEEHNAAIQPGEPLPPPPDPEGE